jgi:hypothetical protein
MISPSGNSSSAPIDWNTVSAQNWTLRNAFQFLASDAAYVFIDTDEGLTRIRVN